MTTKQNTSLFSHRRISSAMAIAVTGAVALGMLLAGLFDNAVAQESNLPDIYGVWVEQDVAPYAADRFEIRPEGVFVGGRQVNTQYQWDGNKLEYLKGETRYSYSFVAGRLIRQSPAHYISSFARQTLLLEQTH
ncbi:hypothetical protein RJ45_13710 [Photobacterium gaetbulicola]|uniref:DUF2850 domain-containing protein n=1 Tax=Photobacterium gaetbulicola TaxID=1295392 RepID=A0A0B9G306_9GAMM|nr:DUF2850 domain-containing protein [Photobacterium gaetbulicola]KHT63133.1 hypothetical protein RJ45_13710 [Photobacterium gaetbulicola]